MQKLKHNTLFVGKVRRNEKSVESTNITAIEWISEKNPHEGSVVLSDYQTAGKGQFGNRWESEKNANILLSIIFYPRFLDAKDQFNLSQTISLAIHDFVSGYVNEQVFLKWPNDIIIQDKKLGGVLIENTIKGKIVDSSVVGIGINVNQGAFSSNLSKATSLHHFSQSTFELPELIDNLLYLIEVRYMELRAQKFDKIKKDYQELLYLFEEEAEFATNFGTIRGKIVGIDENGQLCIRTDKEDLIFRNKEISFPGFERQ